MISLFIAAASTFAITIIAMPLAIRVLHGHDVGEFVEPPVAETAKLGVPTMGGLVLLVAVVVGYLAAHFRISSGSGGVGHRLNEFADQGWLAVGAFLGMGLIGVAHDYTKHVRARVSRTAELFVIAGHLVVAAAFAGSIGRFGVSAELSFARGVGLELQPWLYGVLVVSVLVATTNAVRVSDGLDGLVAGSSAVVFGAYVLVGFWQFRNPRIYGVEGALGLAILAAALVGATAAFLWWNAAPARVSMGQTGSHAVGGAIGALALLTNTHLLLLIFGALYFMASLSVALQLFVYKLRGTRVFRMAPVAHHFVMRGWSENAVVVRFWILSGIAVAVGLGVFYADWAVAVSGRLP